MAARFTRLVLSNWRNFKKVDIRLGSRTFIVGPNASGKTNLIDAFRFLRDIAKPAGSLVGAVEDRRGLKHVRSLRRGGQPCPGSGWYLDRNFLACSRSLRSGLGDR